MYAFKNINGGDCYVSDLRTDRAVDYTNDPEQALTFADVPSALEALTGWVTSAHYMSHGCDFLTLVKLTRETKVVTVAEEL